MEKIKRNKIIKRVGACVLGAAVAAGVVCGIGYGTGIFGGSDGLSDLAAATEEVTEEGSLQVSEQSSNGIKLSGLSVVADSGASYIASYSITATVEPSDATDNTITWSLAWSSTSSATISDYVTLSSETSTSGSSITIYCLQAFTTQLTLTATANGGNDVSASVTLDYVKRYTAFSYSSISVNYVPSDYRLVSTQPITEDYNYFSVDSVFVPGDMYTSVSLSNLDSSGTTTDGTNRDYVFTFTLTSDFLYILAEFNSALVDAAVSNGSYQITAVSRNQTVYTMDDILEGIFGLSSGSLSSYYSSLYYAFLCESSVFNVNLSFTGATTGQTYSIDCECGMDPEGWVTLATAVAFTDSSAVYFYS